jgi:hypothetical protein
MLHAFSDMNNLDLKMKKNDMNVKGELCVWRESTEECEGVMV